MARRLAAAAVAALALAGPLAPRASAHAVLVHSEPADGTALAGAPGGLRLRFNEDISERFRRVQLIDARGRAVAGTSVRRGTDGRELAVAIPRLPRGTYQVDWEVLAEDDGHVTGGALVFGVATRPPAGVRARGAPGTGGAPLDAALRWVDFSLLALLAGGIGMSALLAGFASGPGAVASRRRLLAGASCGATLAAALGVVLFVRQTQALQATLSGGDALGRLVSARWGTLWLAREVALVSVTGAGLLLLRRPARALYAAAGALIVALAVIRALGAHAAAVEPSALAVAAHAAHVLAAAAWAGGVLGLAVAVGSARGEAAELVRAIRRPFAWAAGFSVLALAVTGLYAAGAQVASVDALLETFYGRTLIAKTALVLAAGGFGLGNALLLRRGAASGRLLLAEAAAGVEIMLAAALLAASSPPRGPEFRAPSAAPTPLVVRTVGDVLVTATVRPNRPGANLVSVAAVSTRRPPPAPIDRVLLRRSTALVALRPVAPGRWSGGVAFEQEGRRELAVVVERGGRRLTAAFPWSVAAPDPARPVVVSARRLAPLLDGAALALLLAAAAAIAVRRRPRLSIVDPLGKEAP
jgi:copper transport protein